MKQFNISEDPQRYVAYYHNQAGGYLPGFSGASSMYGAGLGGLFRGLFRMAMPLLKKGIGIAKPHLKAAAKNIVSDVISKVVNHHRDNYPGATLFSQVDVSLGDRLISQGSNTYPYRCIIECLMNYDRQTL